MGLGATPRGLVNHIRHVASFNETLVVSKIARMRAIMDSSVLETREIQHRKVNFQQFQQAFWMRRKTLESDAQQDYYRQVLRKCLHRLLMKFFPQWSHHMFVA